MARSVSARRSCQLVGIGRSSFAYQPRPDRNEELALRMRSLCQEQPRLGYRMAWAQLRDDFAPLNLKRVRRLWKREGLHLVKRSRQRLRGIPRPMLDAIAPNEVWCMDFAHDSCMNGTKIKCFALVDECTRECLALEVERRIPSSRVVQVLEQAFSQYGAPRSIRCDNGPEFASWTLRLFLKRRGVELTFIQPGSPWQNGFAESFIGTLRDGCLDVEAFRNLADAQLKILLWRKFYNEQRPHSSLGYVRPREKRQSFLTDRLQCVGGVTF